MENKILKSLYEEGFFVGPQESEENFLKRVEKTKSLLQNPETLYKKLSLSQKISYKNLLCFEKKMPLGVGAATYIIETDSVDVPVIVVSSRKYFWIKKEEILSHEHVHAKRCAFQEPCFEEILAYRTSKTSWRRRWGALFAHTKDIALVYVSFFSTILCAHFVPSFFLPSLGGFLCSIFYYVGRLFQRTRTLDKAEKTLRNLYKNPQQMLYMLTDKEIFLLASQRHPPTNSLRWQQILAVFERV